MDNKDTKQGLIVVDVMRSESIVDLGKELIELGLDGIIDSEVLKEIPFISTLVGIFDAGQTVRDRLFTNKLLCFLRSLSEIPKMKRVEMVEKLNEDENFAGKAGAAIIEILDRLESERKPDLAGRFFAAYAREEVSFEELRRILFALERVPAFDIDKLEVFSTASIQDSVKMDEAFLLTFVNAGLGKNNGGLDGGAILPTKLCKLFVRAMS